MEFLVNYGWAILVVLVVIGVLNYFGVLSLDTYVPQRCSLPAGITCLDYEVGSALVILFLQNSFGETITIDRIDVARTEDNFCSYTEPVMLENGEKELFIVPDCNNGDVGEKFAGEITITYKKGSFLAHKMSGLIRVKIMTGTTTLSSSIICKNAGDGVLCDGLDLVFGEGYKAECCSEYVLCC